MRRAARARNEYAQSSRVCCTSVLGDIVWRPMCRHYLRLGFNAKLFTSVRRQLHRGPIRVAAHENSDRWCIHLAHPFLSFKSFATLLRIGGQRLQNIFEFKSFLLALLVP